MQLEKGADEQIVERLTNTVYGTPGGLQYSHTGIKERIALQKNLYFIAIRRSEKLLGTIGLNHRQVQIQGSTMASCYVRYFSLGSYLKSGYRKDKKISAGKISGNELKETAFRFFGDREMALPLLKHPQEPLIHYAFVDRDNTRSIEMQEKYGFKTIGTFQTFLLSRFKPKPSKYVSLMEVEEMPMLERKLQEHFGRFNFYTTENLHLPHQYFVMREKGEIVAGVKVLPVRWKVAAIPGMVGLLYMKVLPYLPYLNRIFKAKNHSFIAFEGLFCDKGFEKKLIEFLESVLLETGFYSAQLYLSEKDRLYKYFKNRKDLGLLSKVTQEILIDVNARAINYDPQEMEKLKDSPIYVSALDVT